METADDTQPGANTDAVPAAASASALLKTFSILAVTATSQHAEQAVALEWAALRGRAGSTPGDFEPFWRGVKLAPDEVPLFRRLELGTAWESLRTQGKSPREALGDLLTFCAGAPVICVDEITTAVLRRAARGLLRQSVYSLREIAAIAAPTLTAHSLETLAAGLQVGEPLAGGEGGDARAEAELVAEAAGPEAEPSNEVLNAPARARIGLKVWQALQARMSALPLPVLTEINFLPGIGLHPIQELLRAAEKQAMAGAALGFGGEPGGTAVGPGSKPATLEALWKDFSEIIDPKAEMRLGRGFSVESAEAEARKAERQQQAADAADEAVIAPVTEAEIREVFAAGGPLSRVFKNYEMRAEQVEMAVAVGGALSEGRHLLVEAGTGTGKSLAYLVPAVLFSLRNKTPVVISTHTKTLQNQLMKKDIPILRKALGAVFKAALLKGRSNYLCLRKFNEVLRNANTHLEPDEYEPMPGVVSWAAATGDGDVESCGTIDAARDFRLWGKMHTVGADCLGRKCRYYTRCFVFKARGEARSAHVVVANHALVFASLGREQGALPPLKHVIFDEAHGLEDVATEFLSVKFDRVRLTRQLNRFAREAAGGGGGGSARGGSGTGGGGLLHSLGEGLEKTRSPLTPEVLDLTRARIHTAREAIGDCIREAAQFETALERLFGLGGGTGGPGSSHWPGSGSGHSQRGREFVPEAGERRAETGSAGSGGPGASSARSGRGGYGSGRLMPEKQRYGPDRKRESVWAPIHAARDQLIMAIARVLKPLNLIYDEFELLKPGRFNGAREIEHEWKAQTDFLAEIGQDVEFLVRGENPDYVYWAESSGGPRPRLSLCAAPLNINTMLNEQLWQYCRSAVLTSATLTSEGTFAFVTQRLGLDLVERGRLTTLLLDSSFDYREQCRVLVPAHVSAPDQGAFGQQFEGLIYDAVSASRGRALVLFTSYAALNQAAEGLTGALAEQGVAVLAQGRDGSREQLLTQLQAGPPCAIFGTASFWEGIDVPGEALSLLVVAKLPFPAFKDPLWEARRERLEAQGQSAFQNLDIPVAVLKLRQGFGRLIRSRTDRGVFILADTRVLSRRYGWSFLQALPQRHEVVSGSAAVARAVERFFDGGGPGRGSGRDPEENPGRKGGSRREERYDEPGEFDAW